MSDSPIDSAAPPAEHHDDEKPTDTHHGTTKTGGGDEDSDMDLSDIDEDQFEDYEPELEDRQNVVIDENVTKGLKAAKRQQPKDDKAVKKSKEGRRPKKRSRGDDDDLDPIEDGDRRPRKTRGTDSGRRAAGKAVPEPKEVPEEDLTPEERRRRALAKAMDAALKNPTKRRRKKDEIDLEEEMDDHIAHLKVAMERACIEDNAAREKGQAATHKLKLLPQVTALLNRTAVQNSILDPDTNFLQSVKYFLEPLNDGSLPAYNIQRDIFNALVKLPIQKDALLSSGIGKVVFFYTKSKQPVPAIKRIAERLVGEWSRPVLKRTDDYKKRHIETRNFDISAAKKAQLEAGAVGSSSQITLTQRPAGKSRFEIERERALAPEVRGNRAVMPGLPQSYTVAPKSTFNPSQAGAEHRPIGSGGAEAFRKMITKGKGGGRR
ncbi:transcription factor iws-1 [Podospora fimiseda]|uniref:Transcription factor iws-1 n=1 Tax=Podospora fimiseda TaxID=252190 RepID=A0AAN7H800_9PEZI|nr:transcription factor iws-1 [Podospora fimiseda]